MSEFHEKKIPSHIAIIMDGNARWAKFNDKSIEYGYKKGIQAAQKTIKNTRELGIKYLTLFAFSLENWNRASNEVEILMDLLRQFLDNNIEELLNEGIDISFIGDLTRLDPDIREKINDIEEKSEKNSGFKLRIAVSYGARYEISKNILKFSEQVRDQDLRLSAEEIEKKFESFINPKNFPDPDLLIRTSGEYRISNFLLWEIAYTELMFVDKLWPDFNKSDLENAIDIFSKRERRFGK